MNTFLSIGECVETYISGVVNKAKTSNLVMFGKAILAGGMIAIGAAGSNVASHSVSNVGASRMMAGTIFPVGLMMVILLGAELFTGDCMMLIGAADKKVSIIDVIRMLLIIYVGNFVGSVIVATLAFYSGQFNYTNGLLGAFTIKVALGKANLTFVQGLTSGILCNILVCAAVLIAMCSKDVTGKLMASFFVILAFVTSGYEHCVANMYYIPAGLIAKLNPDYVNVAMNTYNLTEQQIASLNISNFFVSNLLPVTIGNILGGAVFLGLPLYYLNRKK